MTFLTGLFLMGIFLGVYTEDDMPRVKTPLGGIKGYYKMSYEGRQFEAYEGIPYALPPTGKLRFKPPQRVPAWLGELAATKIAHECMQYQIVPKDPDLKVTGAEDCLYLNVYVPVKKEARTESLPVLFWIHGGAFQYGSGSQYGPKYLLDRDVILVTINYRLGPFGFLSTEDDIVPGNMGLKDQSLALRWVSENIEWFRGDPKKITITGLSAGGVSVHYHYLSPTSAGLFQGGISFSGTALDSWAQTEKPLEKTKKLATILGCPTASSREMVRCLRYRPSQTISQAVGEFMPWFFNPFTPFGPVVEKHGDQPFINQSPIEIITNGNVYDAPWVTGVVSEEGIYPVGEFAADKKHLKELNDNWEKIAPFLLDYNYTLPRERHSEVAKLIKNHYLGSKTIDRLTVKPLIQMVGDRMFVIDLEKAARLQAKANKNPVWFYYYSYRSVHSLSEALSGSTENFGVSHADDVYLVLENSVIDPTTTAQDLAMQKDLMNFWMSFANNKVPKFENVEWMEVDPSKKNLTLLHIVSPGNYKMEENPNLGEKNFWNTINFNENKMKHKASTKDEF